MRASALLAVAATAMLAPCLGRAAWPAIQWQVGLQGNPGFTLASPRAAADPSGNVFITARESDGQRSCMLVAKQSANAAIAWRKSICDLDVEPRSIAVDSLGNVVVGGSVRASGGTSNARILKLDGQDGRTHWDRVFDLGAAAADEAAVDIAIDAARDIHVALTSASSVARLVKYSEGGTLRWQSEPFARLVAVALDAAGNPFSLGGLQASGADRWVVMRHSPTNGAAVWTEIGAVGSIGRAIAIDASGNAVVTGSVLARATTDMHTVKYAAANGQILWQRDLLAASDSAGTAVEVDPWGDVIVTGRAGLARETLAHSGRDGGVMWRRTVAGRDGRAATGTAIVFDPSGNPIVLGEEGPPGQSTGNFSIRTTALTTQAGDEIWSIPFDGPASGSTDRPGSLVATANGVVMVGETLNSGGLVLAKYSFGIAPPINVQGLWWRSPSGSQSGWGVNVVQQGDVLFATWFTYDAQRRPLWMVMSEGVRTGVAEYTGTMYQVTGPAFDSATWDTARVQARAVGTATFSFANAASGTFRFTDSTNGLSVAHPITPQLFASPVPVCDLGDTPSATNFTDLWWRSPAGSESGWGINLIHQGDVIFATWFTYGADGSPLWLVASDLRRTGAGTFAGDLYRTSGPAWFAVPWDPNTVTVTRVGSASLAFSGAGAGTFSYTVDGVSGSKTITRQLFSAPQTVCR